MERVRKQHYNEHLMGKKPREAKKKPIKIKYISSPVMVQANNASEFRAIVQELTGLNSNIIESSSIHPHHDDQHTTTTAAAAHEYSRISGDAMSSWVGVHDHDQPPQTRRTNYENVDDQFSSFMTFLAQFDRHDDDHHHDQAHFTRSHVPESFYDFQSPYHVFA